MKKWSNLMKMNRKAIRDRLALKPLRENLGNALLFGINL